ncbi:MAG: hypothetical protein AB1Z19_02985 [Eubacteriales bacterium]
MAIKSSDSTSLLEKAEAAFKNEDYAKTYNLCTELMKGKTASVVVYMQCVASLKLAESSKDFVDALIDDTLLFAIALDNFYVQSNMRNKNIETYIQETLFTLLTSLIINIQKNYPYKSPKRSFKNAFSGAQASIANLRKLKAYDFSKFHIDLPKRLSDFAEETAEKLIAHVTNSINISKDITNNWLYEDETNDLFERIINYKASLAVPEQAETPSGEDDPSFQMKKSEINDYIDDISSDIDGEFKLDELDDINIAPPTEVKVNENYSGEDQKVTVSQVLGQTDDGEKPKKDAPSKDNTLSLTGKTQLKRDKRTKEKPQTQANAEVIDTLESEFKGFSIKKDKPKDVFVMPEALDDFSDVERQAKGKRGKSSKKQSTDFLIWVFVVLFISAVAYIIFYFLSI